MVYKDYYDKDLKQVDNEEQAVWVKITYCDPTGLPEFTKMIKKEEK